MSPKLAQCGPPKGGIMSTLSFAGEMARLQRTFSESHDAVVRRSIVLDALNLRTGERVLELGCGASQCSPPAARADLATGRLPSSNISPKKIASAQDISAQFAGIEC